MPNNFTQAQIRGILKINENQLGQLYTTLNAELESRGLTQSGLGWENNLFSQRPEEFKAAVDWLITEMYPTYLPATNEVEEMRRAVRAMVANLRRRASHRRNMDNRRSSQGPSNIAPGASTVQAPAQVPTLSIVSTAQTTTQAPVVQVSAPTTTLLAPATIARPLAMAPLVPALPNLILPPLDFTPRPAVPAQVVPHKLMDNLGPADFLDDGIPPSPLLDSLRLIVTNEANGRNVRTTFAQLVPVDLYAYAYAFDQASIRLLWDKIRAQMQLPGRHALICRHFEPNIVFRSDTDLNVLLRELVDGGLRTVHLSLV